jgi:hypothetical protein
VHPLHPDTRLRLARIRAAESRRRADARRPARAVRPGGAPRRRSLPGGAPVRHRIGPVLAEAGLRPALSGRSAAAS